jgi:hypothetical protein
MKLDIGNPAHFHNEPVPEGTRLAGWAALVHVLDVKAPVRNPRLYFRTACARQSPGGGQLGGL